MIFERAKFTLSLCVVENFIEILLKGLNRKNNSDIFVVNLQSGNSLFYCHFLLLLC